MNPKGRALRFDLGRTEDLEDLTDVEQNVRMSRNGVGPAADKREPRAAGPVAVERFVSRGQGSSTRSLSSREQVVGFAELAHSSRSSLAALSAVFVGCSAVGTSGEPGSLEVQVVLPANAHGQLYGGIGAVRSVLACSGDDALTAPVKRPSLGGSAMASMFDAVLMLGAFNSDGD